MLRVVGSKNVGRKVSNFSLIQEIRQAWPEWALENGLLIAGEFQNLKLNRMTKISQKFFECHGIM